jgi:DNA-binding beta-propeller fold protein YncE
MKSLLRLLTLSVAGCAAFALPSESRAQLLITGNDEKVSFDENTGKTITHPAGKDTVSIIDIADPAKPKIIANLPLMNTITGPPVNLAITRDRHLALVANSLDWVKDGDGWKGVPDNKIYVIDLTASPPTQIGTVEAGKQASGMAINRAGTLALVANRAEDSVTVLAIDGKNVKPVGSVSVATQPTAAVAAPPPALPVAVAITPDGKRALVAKSGDGPEGLAISPAGGYAASLLLNGTGGTPKTAFYRHDKSYVALLKIDGKTVRKVAQADVGGLAEGIAFSPDGRYLYVGNFVDGDIDILRVDGDTLTKVANLALPGHPASMRGSTP